jgi:hypothetical protein
MIIFQDHRRRLPSVLLSAIGQDFYAKPVAWTQPSSPDSCTKSAAETSGPEQAMIPQQAMMNDALSPHTPSPLPAGADATVTGTDIVDLAGLQPQPVEWLWQHRLKPDTALYASAEHPAAQVIQPRFAAFAAPKTENQVPGGGLCRIRRISTLWSTRQDAQINYLSTLSIFMKQTTYLATLPNPKSEANECVYDGAVRDGSFLYRFQQSSSPV